MGSVPTRTGLRTRFCPGNEGVNTTSLVEVGGELPEVAKLPELPGKKEFDGAIQQHAYLVPSTSSYYAYYAWFGASRF